VAAECSATWSWGLQPATAFIDWVSSSQQPAIVSLASLKIEVGGHTFYGYCKNVTPKLGTDGISLMQEFVDNRDFLMWDLVYGVFNMPEHKIVNGQFVRRYWHILPVNYNTRTKTYTNSPYTAEELLDFLFEAPTIESPWIRQYFNNFTEYTAMGAPVFQLDFENGVYLGQAVLQVTEALGMVFTLMGGPYQLVWTMKGIGSLPSFPANSDNRRNGKSISPNPTRVRILGDRNRYQVLECVLQPDWLPAWQTNFGLDFAQFIQDIHDNEKTEAAIGTSGQPGYIPPNTAYTAIPSDPDGIIGWSLAGARARLLTVGQYAALRDARHAGDGAAYRDTRRFQGRSRTQLPVALYLSQIVWRAFRLSSNFSIRLSNGLMAGLLGLDLDDRAVVDVTHDPVTGQMTYTNAIPPSSEHNGYAIVRGFQVAQEAFNALRPDYFNLNDFINAQQLWNATPFQIDDSGEGDQFILFDQPALQSGNLIKQIEISGVKQAYPDGRPRVAIDATQMPTAPDVKAALVFLGEKFSYVAGIGTKDGVENITGLNGEYVGYANGSSPVEQPFADGQKASQKAAAIATSLLNLQFVYDTGGYTVQGSNATQLSSVIDRVTVRLNSSDGLTEEVDFTNERARNVVFYGPMAVAQIEPEREFDRKAQLAPLFPGQEQLKVEANQLRLDAAAIRSDKKQGRMIADTFHLLLGMDSPPKPVFVKTTGGAITLPFGAPLFRDAGDNLAQKPDNSGSGTAMTSPVFMGMTVMENQSTSKSVAVTSNGDGGVVHARVKGPVAVSDNIGLSSDNKARDYLVTGPTLVCARALEAISDTSIKLIRVSLYGAGASSTGGLNARGLWVAGTVYSAFDLVVVQSGPALGTYYSTIDGNANDPATGIGWLQIAPGNTVGEWA